MLKKDADSIILRKVLTKVYQYDSITGLSFVDKQYREEWYERVNLDGTAKCGRMCGDFGDKFGC